MKKHTMEVFVNGQRVFIRHYETSFMNDAIREVGKALEQTDAIAQLLDDIEVIPVKQYDLV